MKLYTEERIKEVLEELQKALLPENIECDGAYCMGCWKDVVRDSIKMLKELSPIELPTDEEIKEKISENIPNDEIDKYTAIFYFTKGAKYVIKKIQGGN